LDEEYDPTKRVCRGSQEEAESLVIGSRKPVEGPWLTEVYAQATWTIHQLRRSAVDELRSFKTMTYYHDSMHMQGGDYLTNWRTIQ
jgi:hypothetical protein